jgi:hypothetical protein
MTVLLNIRVWEGFVVCSLEGRSHRAAGMPECCVHFAAEYLPIACRSPTAHREFKRESNLDLPHSSSLLKFIMHGAQFVR